VRELTERENECAHTKQMNKQGDKVPACASDGFEKRFLRGAFAANLLPICACEFMVFSSRWIIITNSSQTVHRTH
jgi:hypothetical protein